MFADSCDSGIQTYLEEKFKLVVDLLGGHARAPAEEYEGLAYGELAVERYLLGHVADPWSGHPRALGARPAAQHPDLAGIEPATADYAGQEGRLAAAARAQEAVAVEEKTILLYLGILHQR